MGKCVPPYSRGPLKLHRNVDFVLALLPIVQ